MESRVCIIFLLYSTIAAAFFIHCDARKSMGLFKDPKHSVIKHSKKLQLMNQLMSLVIEQPTDTSNSQPYGVSSPFSLPPFDSLPPVNSPPNGPLAPATISPTTPSPPLAFSNSPPSPPAIVQSPPFYVPTPVGSTSPPVFLPPIVYPTPTVPPPPDVVPSTALWCVAKPSVPDPIIQEAMNYACGTGADCDSIQPNGSCFQPDTLFAHASYAFNSFWQRTKVSGGACEFGGTAILVADDPSYEGCHFEYNF
ncbi:hypothetical protein PTKIN_Ptkin17bG0054700 [Pterospermum kingtungense]